MQPWIPYLIVAAGLFSAAGGLCGWSWFLNSRKARLWVRLLGPGGARAFYVLLGLALAALGVALAAGALEPPSTGG